MKTKAAHGGAVMDFRNFRLLVFCFFLGTTALMLASTSVLHRKPDHLARDPSSSRGSTYGIRKPFPAQSLNALAEDEPAYTASNHQAVHRSEQAVQEMLVREALRRQGEEDAAGGPENVVQDAVTFRDDVLLVVRVSDSRARLDREFKLKGNGSFFCIFDFPEQAVVFHTPVSSVNRKQGSGNLYYVKCAHPSDGHQASPRLLGDDGEVVEDPQSSWLAADGSKQWGRVTLGVQGAQHFASRAKYRPLFVAAPTWEEPLVYEITTQEEGIVVLAKNLNSRGSNKYFDVQDLSCVFMRLGHLSSHGEVGADEVVHTTKALLGAQEVVHCEWPSVEVRESLVGLKVSVSGSRYGGVVASVAYFHPEGSRALPAKEEEEPVEEDYAAGDVEVSAGAESRVFSTEAGSGEHKYHLCACTMLWNKAKFLKEWVMYHTHLGAERFFIYDNNSDDDLDDVVASLNNRKCGLLTDEEAQMDEQLLGQYSLSSQVWPWLKTQQAAFSHCAVRARREGCEWVMFVDVDEFIHPISYMKEVTAGNAVRKREWAEESIIGTTKKVGKLRAARKLKDRSRLKGKRAKLGGVRELLSIDETGAEDVATQAEPKLRGELVQFEEELRANQRPSIYTHNDFFPRETVPEETRRNVVSVSEDETAQLEHEEEGCDARNPTRGSGQGKLRTLIKDVATDRRPLFVRVNGSEPPSRIGEIRFDCHNFGPSGLKHHPTKGVVMGYTCRDFSPQRHKSIVRTDALSVSLLNLLHHFELRPGFESVSMVRKFAVVNHYKFQVWEDFKLKFVRRAGTYTTDWTSKQNKNSNDRTPGLATEPVMPEDWHKRFCQVRDTRLKDYVKRTFTTKSDKLLWQ